jgi:hypothetical protein
MAHYAKLDDNNIVINVIVIADKDCLDENGNECEEPGRRLCEALTGHANWKKTSYNTKLGIHYDPNTGEPSEDQSKSYRLNFARIGMRYDEELDGFVVSEQIEPKRVPRMTINPVTGMWGLIHPGIPMPEDLELEKYPLEEYKEEWYWNENLFEWVKVKKPSENASPIFLPHIFHETELLQND